MSFSFCDERIFLVRNHAWLRAPAAHTQIPASDIHFIYHCSNSQNTNLCLAWKILSKQGHLNMLLHGGNTIYYIQTSNINDKLMAWTLLILLGTLEFFKTNIEYVGQSHCMGLFSFKESVGSYLLIGSIVLLEPLISFE